jgi:aryl-alcohol dehydrogenase-like predicted oxidoreductase
MRVALGTVQFGLRYGVANPGGQVPHDEAERILNEARQAGIDTLDTAVAYGNSEERLGELGVKNWNVVSKLPELPKDVEDVDVWVKRQVQGSLARMRIDRLDGLLLHKPSDMLSSHRFAYARALERIREQGLARSIGYSIYAPEELPELCNAFAPDLVQAPYNLLDRRLESSGWMSRLVGEGVRIHTRSAFLQGLLLMPESERPARFDRWRSLWQMWTRACADLQSTPLELSLGFVLSQPAIERVVVGVDCAPHLREILASARRPPTHGFPQIESRDLDLIEPSRWSIT